MSQRQNDGRGYKIVLSSKSIGNADSPGAVVWHRLDIDGPTIVRMSSNGTLNAAGTQTGVRLYATYAAQPPVIGSGQLFTSKGYYLFLDRPGIWWLAALAPSGFTSSVGSVECQALPLDPEATSFYARDSAATIIRDYEIDLDAGDSYTIAANNDRRLLYLQAGLANTAGSLKVACGRTPNVLFNDEALSPQIPCGGFDFGITGTMTFETGGGLWLGTFVIKNVSAVNNQRIYIFETI